MANFRKALQEAVGIREAKEEDGLEDALASFVDGLNKGDLVSLWNKYEDLEHSMSRYIYDNDEGFFSKYFDYPYDVMKCVYDSYHSYDYNDKYVVFDAGKLESFNDPEQYISESELVDWLVNNIEYAEQYGFEYEE